MLRTCNKVIKVSISKYRGIFPFCEVKKQATCWEKGVQGEVPWRVSRSVPLPLSRPKRFAENSSGTVAYL